MLLHLTKTKIKAIADQLLEREKRFRAWKVLDLVLPLKERATLHLILKLLELFQILDNPVLLITVKWGQLISKLILWLHHLCNSWLKKLRRRLMQAEIRFSLKEIVRSQHFSRDINLTQESLIRLQSRLLPFSQLVKWEDSQDHSLTQAEIKPTKQPSLNQIWWASRI